MAPARLNGGMSVTPAPQPRLVLQPAATGQRRSALMVGESAQVLKRFHFLERELVRMAAGWLPGTTDWETKLLLPEVLWQDALVARSLRERVLELRYPERRIAIDQDAALVGLYANCLHAPSDLAFVMGLARAVKPHLRGLLADYLKLADALDDAPSVHLLEHALVDLDRQLARLEAVTTEFATRRPELVASAERWNAGVTAALAGATAERVFAATLPEFAAFDPSAAGGRTFAISRTGQRDARFTRVRFAWPDRHTPQPPGAGVQLQVRQAIHHLNEVWAAEMAGACLYDFLEQAPHDFLEDAARWCFDEIRHCRMGYERLKQWGFSEAEMPLDAFSYDSGQHADAIVRLGVIFYFETTYIHTKPERAKIFGAEGDRLSSHDMDFDWADELIHSHYGKKWLTHFLAQAGIQRTPIEIKQQAEAGVLTFQQSATTEDKAATQAIFDRMMSKARQRLESAA